MGCVPNCTGLQGVLHKLKKYCWSGFVAKVKNGLIGCFN